MRRPCLLLRWGRERAPGPANVCVCEHMWMCRSAVACTICRKADDFFFEKRIRLFERQVRPELRRLGVETIDLYQLHRLDPHTPVL